MLPYCLKCRKIMESKNPKVARAKNRRIMFLSTCVVCNSKISKFFQQESGGLISNLAGVNVPVLSNLL